MRKLLYFLPAVLLFGVNGAVGQSPSMKDPPAQKRSSARDQAPLTSAQSVAGAKDDQPVKLRGQLVSKKGRNEYVFSDGTGNVDVEIGARAFKGDNDKLKAGTQVEIVGQVETRRNKQPKIDAKTVTILAAAGGTSGAPMSSDRPSGSSNSASPSKTQPGAGGSPQKRGY